MPSHDHILKLLHRAALSAEDAMDSARRRLRAATGRGEPKHIAAYHGYADASRVRVSGRVLANRPGGGPLDDDRWWDNLVNTWRRWESDEVPGAVVHLRFGEQEQRVVADEEGYYEAQFERTEESHDGLLWLEAEARAGIDGNGVRATHDVLVPSRHAAFGIISDLDDTVVHTGITSLLLAAKLTFLENAKTRKPLDGVAKLYEALQQGKAERRINPLFYISSSPWNLYDLLVDFLRLNEIPPGPLLLRDLGLDATKFIKEKGHGHKQRKAQALLESYPDLPFVLVGDSGQDDPAIYADLAAEHPERILAIYIRDVDPDRDTIFDQSADRARDRADALGVPMILAKDSLMITEHAQRIGLIPPSALTDVIEEIDKDRERPETGEQAVKDAVASLGPEA
jgi:phosphatidate phosphatase APP1